MARLLLSRGAKFIAHRMHTPYGELDLLFRSRDIYWAVEVKSSSNEAFAAHRLKKGQRVRLERIRLYLESQLRAPVILGLALVDARGKILLFNL